MDIANAVWKAQDRGKSSGDLAEEYGLSKRQIQRYRALIDFPDPIKDALSDGMITMNHAQVLISFDVKNPESWIKDIADQEMSARKLNSQLKQKVGVMGRPRTYLRRKDQGFRLFPLKLDQETSAKERKRIIEVLTQALEIAKKLDAAVAK